MANEVRDYQICGTKEQLDNLEKIFHLIEYLEETDSVGTVVMEINGHAIDTMSIDGLYTKRPELESKTLYDTKPRQGTPNHDMVPIETYVVKI